VEFCRVALVLLAVEEEFVADEVEAVVFAETEPDAVTVAFTGVVVEFWPLLDVVNGDVVLEETVLVELIAVLVVLLKEVELVVVVAGGGVKDDVELLAS